VLRSGLAAAEAARDPQGQATMLGLLMHAEALRDEHHASAGYAARAFAAYQALSTPPSPFEQPSTLCSAALREARARRDALAVGFAACQLALSARLDAAHVDYLTLFEEARDAFRIGGAPLLELWTIKNTGLVYLRQRRFAEAEESLRRGQVLLAGGGGPDAKGGDLAGVAAAYGRADLAELLANTAITDARRTGDRWSEGRALITLADLHVSHDNPLAAGIYREALAVWRELRMPRRVAQVEQALARLEGTGFT
jgi:hypothetical protein